MFPKTEVIRVGRMGTIGARKVARTLKMGRKSAAKITVVDAEVATAATVVVSVVDHSVAAAAAATAAVAAAAAAQQG